MEITIQNNIITYENNSGVVFLYQKIDDEFIHIGFGQGMIIGLHCNQNSFNGLTFNNSDELIDYLDGIIKKYIDSSDGMITLNGQYVTPTNTIIDYAVQESDRVVIEVNETLYDCFLSNTYINGQFATDLTTLYNTYLTLLP
jgi:hypothetical protein